MPDPSDPIATNPIVTSIFTGVISKITADMLLTPVKNFLSKIKLFNQSAICDVSTPEQQKLFYQKVNEIYANASKDIYIIGSGIRPADDKNVFLLQDAGLRTALNNKVKLYRFQTNRNYSEEWMRTYSSLDRDFPGYVEIYKDFQNSQNVSTALIDPDGQNPILIETRQTQNYAGDHEITVLALGLFIYNQKNLAIALKNQLLERKKILPKIDLKEVSDVKILTDNPTLVD
jgi:hypothetical protein